MDLPGVLDDESACNGTQGASAGFDAAIEYHLGRRVGVGVAVGLVATRLHAEVHRTARDLFARPVAHIAFVPLRVTASVEVASGPRWGLRIGPQIGVGVFGAADVRPEFGRARRFEGDSRILLGAQVAASRAFGTRGWGLAASFQYLRTGIKAAELETGDLPQQIDFDPISILVGVQYAFGRRAQ